MYHGLDVVGKAITKLILAIAEHVQINQVDSEDFSRWLRNNWRGAAPGIGVHVFATVVKRILKVAPEARLGVFYDLNHNELLGPIQPMTKDFVHHLVVVRTSQVAAGNLGWVMGNYEIYMNGAWIKKHNSNYHMLVVGLLYESLRPLHDSKQLYAYRYEYIKQKCQLNAADTFKFNIHNIDPSKNPPPDPRIYIMPPFLMSSSRIDSKYLPAACTETTTPAKKKKIKKTI